MSENQMLYCLIAFILGWLLSKYMVRGNGFSIGITSDGKTSDGKMDCTSNPTVQKQSCQMYERCLNYGKKSIEYCNNLPDCKVDKSICNKYNIVIPEKDTNKKVCEDGSKPIPPKECIGSACNDDDKPHCCGECWWDQKKKSEACVPECNSDGKCKSGYCNHNDICYKELWDPGANKCDYKRIKKYKW